MQGHYAALLPITKEYCSADEDRLFVTCLSKTMTLQMASLAMNTVLAEDRRPLRLARFQCVSLDRSFLFHVSNGVAAFT